VEDFTQITAQCMGDPKTVERKSNLVAIYCVAPQNRICYEKW